MKKSLLLCLLFITGLGAMAQKKEKALLYEISGKGMASPSYLLGTFHLLCAKDLPKDSILFQKLYASDKLVLELDVTNTAKMMGGMQSMMYTDTPSWTRKIAPDTLAKMEKVFKESTKMNLSAMARLKPIMVSTLLLPALLDCPTKSMEMEFTAAAKARKIEIGELETVERQMKALGSTPIDKQISDLKEVLMDMDSARNAMKNMMSMYLQKDLSGIAGMMEEQEKKGSTSIEAMLSSRNREWIPLMQNMMRNQRIFFAVGAGHLPGKEGVIELLKKEGYTVKPVW